jgi:hypothetical protein
MTRGPGLTLPLAFLPASLAVMALVSSTSLTVSPNSVLVGQPATLTATVTGAGPVPTGIVDFRAVCPPPCAAPSPPPFASVRLDPTGNAATTITLSETGAHYFTATYNGDPTYGLSSASLTVFVGVAPIPTLDGRGLAALALLLAAGGTILAGTTTKAG